MYSKVSEKVSFKSSYRKKNVFESLISIKYQPKNLIGSLFKIAFRYLKDALCKNECFE